MVLELKFNFRTINFVQFLFSTKLMKTELSTKNHINFNFHYDSQRFSYFYDQPKNFTEYNNPLHAIRYDAIRFSLI